MSFGPKDWGSRRRVSDRLVDQWPIEALTAFLDYPMSEVPSVLPPLWHWVIFKDPTLTSRIGSDGHPVRGEFLPPIQLRRRMHAGGTLAFESPVVVGDVAQSAEEVVSVEEKTGRSGDLVFVMIGRTVTVSGSRAIHETQNLVYTDAEPMVPDPVPERVHCDWRTCFTPDLPMLFRFSALTYNSHRIHYDRRYARDEGYKDAVVQGPLIALRLAELARVNGSGRPTRFSFRAISPALVGETISLDGQKTEGGGVLLRAHVGGRTVMRASLT